jgi:hypothetical protein
VPVADGLAGFTQEVNELALGQLLDFDPSCPDSFVGERCL